MVKETGTWLEITNLVIPGENDSDTEFDRMSRWIADRLGPDVPLHFSAFHPDWKFTHRPFTPRSSLRRARRIALENGLRHVYTGNVHDPEGDSTYCPACNKRVIERDWYELGTWRLEENGNCGHCGTSIAGRFEARPGHFGSRRIPVRIAH